MKARRREFLAAVTAGGGRWSLTPAAASGAAWRASRRAPPRVECEAAATAPIRFAADALEKYLEAILGAVPTGQQAQSPRILLHEVNDQALGEEGFEIACHGRTLAIRGSPSGIVYGVFEFLRRFGGCQFSGLGPDCEHVPRLERIEVAAPVRMTPQLWYRGYQFFYAEPLPLVIQRLDWMAKNGLNYVMFTPRRDDVAGLGAAVDPATGEPAGVSDHMFTESWWKENVQPEVLKRGLKLDFNHHNLFYWLPPQRYFATHPEWYAMADSERTVTPRQLAICTSNEQAVATLVANFKQYLRENPEVRIVGVIVEDGLGMCQCEKCVQGDASPDDAFRVYRGHKDPRAENRSKTLRYARLVNRVARDIRGEFPEVLVGHAAYVDMQWPPRGLKLESNVATWVAIYWRDAAHPLAPDSASPVNRFLMDILAQWRATHPGRLIAYEYYMGMEAQKSLPYLMSEVICRDWPNLKHAGVEGATIQSWSANHNAYALNNLAFARNGWEDRVNHAALLDGYLSGMFGSVGLELKPVFEGLLRALADVEKQGPEVSPWMSRYDAQTTAGGSFLPDAYTIVYLMDRLGPTVLDRAIRRATEKAANARERKQVDAFATVTRYWRRAADALRWDLQARTAEQQGDRPRAELMMSEALTGCERVLEGLDELPPGWLSVATAGAWRRVAADLRRRAAALRL